jgi:hypothetical protein
MTRNLIPAAAWAVGMVSLPSALAAAPLEPPLEQAAEARALEEACAELQPEVAAHVQQAVFDWWERNVHLQEAVHALEFGPSTPERRRRLRALTDRRLELLEQARRERARDDGETLAARCVRFFDMSPEKPTEPRATTPP